MGRLTESSVYNAQIILEQHEPALDRLAWSDGYPQHRRPIIGFNQSTEADMDEQNGRHDDVLIELNRILIKALREMSTAGRLDEACGYSGQAWSVLRHQYPKEAERHNGLLHYLTAPHKNPGGIKS